MSDLISRQAAIDALVKAIREDPYYDSNESINGLGVCDVRVILNDLPATVKRGRWYIDAEGNVRCTVCETKCLRDDIGVNILSNYCPNCGAKMEG